MQAPEAPRTPSLGALHGTYLGRVVDVADPENLARVKVRLTTTSPGVGDTDAAVWARVAVPFAGGGRGAFFLPDVDDEVAVVFVNGDPRQPLVVGALWSGSAKAPDELGGNRVDRWTITGKRGSRVAIVEAADGQATVTISTPGGESITVEQTSGGRIVVEAANNKITLDTKGVTVDAAQKVTVNGAQVEVNAADVKVNAVMSTFSGIVKCDVLQAVTVVANTYTPGAGNVW
ncbi:phage baseplate assembly protein V [Polyangium mundeleinium]|uniref:Phage baseplate assembly protein V n=1 Tax=Polyangium mundeleinium TaxID=2995306 RepID=A0ABT5F198_9BACT|nr:phage baseplate assembly protein V [Polyangium mundeleinium]MDC0747860.1 phage baseplate assembly protein V [Polyangium mundeleinium]